MRTGCLLAALMLLVSPPALAQVKGAPGIVAVVPPPLSSVPASKGGCTPFNPCAVSTPALGNVTLPAPVILPQPDRLATAAAPPARPAPPSGEKGENTEPVATR